MAEGKERMESAPLPKEEVDELMLMAKAYKAQRGRLPEDAGKRMQRMRSVLEALRFDLVPGKGVDSKSGMMVDGRVMKGNLTPETVQLTTDLMKELGGTYASFMHDLIESRPLLDVQNEIDAVEEEKRREYLDEETGFRKAAEDRETATRMQAAAVEQVRHSAEVGQKEAEAKLNRLANALLESRHAGTIEQQYAAFAHSIDLLFGSATVHGHGGTRVDADLARALEVIKRPKSFIGANLSKQVKDLIDSGALGNYLRGYVRWLDKQNRPVPEILQNI